MIKTNNNLDWTDWLHYCGDSYDYRIQGDEYMYCENTSDNYIVADKITAGKLDEKEMKKISVDFLNCIPNMRLVCPDYKKIIFSGPATIVLWRDGTKTIVKCGENDTFDPEKGVALCFMKKILGNTSHQLNKVLKDALSSYEEK